MKDQLIRENIIGNSLSDRDQYLWRLEAIAHLQTRDFQNLNTFARYDFQRVSKHNLYNLQNFGV